jgi:hypothetical protein
MKKIEKSSLINEYEVKIKVSEHDPKTLRFRETIGNGEFDGHKIEVSLCVSRGHIYVMSEGWKQFSVSIVELTQAILEQCTGEKKGE